MFTRTDMCTKLRSLGLGRGDRLLVHSSFRSLGPVDGGPDALLDALLETVGAEGTVAVPTFNYEIPTPWYDPLQTPSRTGVLPEVLRSRPGARRSLHPTHSIAAIGACAEAYTAGHLDGGACTVGSPVDRIAQAGGYVMLLGVSHTSNTTIHVGEAHAGIRKFPAWDGPAPLARVRMPDGAIREY